jgi:hypothetical protein
MRGEIITRRRYRIKLSFSIVKPETLIYILSEPVKFLLIKTIESIESLESYIKNFTEALPSLQAAKTRGGAGVAAKFYEQILNNRKFLKEIFSLGEARKIEFISVFDEILKTYLNKYAMELSKDPDRLDSIIALFEELNEIAVQVLNNKYTSSLDEIYITREMTKRLNKMEV